MATTTKPTWASIDAQNANEVQAVRLQESAKARQRVRTAVDKLKNQGILDAQGRRIRKELPADMREDSGCDMSRL